MPENVHCFSVKHYTNYLMNNLLPLSQAANHASSLQKSSLVASGAAALTTRFCSVPFGLATNCPSSMCFWETLPKTPNNYLCQVLSVHNRQLWKQPSLLKPPQEQSFPAKQTFLGCRNLTDRGKHAQTSCSFWGWILLLAGKLFWFMSEQVCSAPRPKQLWPPFTPEQL